MITIISRTVQDRIVPSESTQPKQVNNKKLMYKLNNDTRRELRLLDGVM